MIRNKSSEYFEKAKKLFPGGVNSPVRAFKSVSGDPVFIKQGKGSRLADVDGNEYLDFCASYGPLILGHAPEPVVAAIKAAAENGTSYGAPTMAENELADLIISNHRFIEKIRFVSSGTEAVMSAIRLARGYTKRNKIIKFEGCYHGHADSLLVKAGSGLATLGTSSSAGIPEAFTAETVVLPLNDREAVSAAFEKYSGDIACVIIEPIPANNGLLLQHKEYLEFLREVCTANGALLLFDEVISGFRIGFEGAAAFYEVKPDLLTFGKIIGGGMPVGAYAGSAQIMDLIAPEGPVYQAGTLSGNPVAMSAGIAQIRECLKPEFYSGLAEKTKPFCEKIQHHVASKNYPFRMIHIGSIFWCSFSSETEIRESAKIDPAGMQHFKTLHGLLLDEGIYLGPSGYEVGFVSAAHTPEELSWAADRFCAALDEIFKE